MIARSLRWRLLLAAASAIFVSLLLAWGFMTILFERHLERRLQAEMTRDGLSLIAATTISADGMVQVTNELPDARFQKAAAGYYWQLTSATGAVASRSLWDVELPADRHADADAWTLRRVKGPFEREVAILERRVHLDADHPALLVQLAQDTQPVVDARKEFGQELAWFLVVLWLMLSAAAWVQVSLGLRPLRAIRGELAVLRASAGARLTRAPLQEIQPLADAINELADAREEDLDRARQRAADLAHALKTPLAAMAAQSRRARHEGAVLSADGMDRAIAAMGSTVDAELARARVAEVSRISSRTCNVSQVAERLVSVLEHTERGEQLAFDVAMPVDLELPIAAETLSELLGPVLENAARHARRQVRIVANEDMQRIFISVEDDGAGIPDEQVRDAMVRGRRLDEAGSGTGSGLGLAIARELTAVTSGTMILDASSLGGLRVCFGWSRHIPSAS